MINIITNTFDNNNKWHNPVESEAELENKLLKHLESQDYELVNDKVFDQESLLSNLKEQLNIHNKKKLNWFDLSNSEFDRILSHLNKDWIFEKAKKLRDKFWLVRDDNNWDDTYIEFLNQDKWCQNQFQVTNQITINWKYVNRYDVTILINWLPLVQIELKKRWVALNEAFNQINRYKKHTFNINKSLFQFTQILIISNWVNTKYYSNNPIPKSTKQEGLHSFNQTFNWADKENKNINNLFDFSTSFLNTCHISKMISKFMVLHSNWTMMILRPYQYYASEAVLNLIDNNSWNGYIWHTTWSWKTLTSFKTSQLISQLSIVDKIFFVVDRNDLDHQTVEEFNSFKEWSVDWTNNTNKLIKQILDPSVKLIVTTIQKLNMAVSNNKYSKQLKEFKNNKFVFLFDECHRSQFWDTHQKIKTFFTNNQMIGYTWTPIFADNHNNKKTTEDLFHKELHKYIITDAINDKNVLRFSVEYVWKYKKKNTKNEIDILVEGDINDKEVLDSPDRLNKITDYIIQNHNQKTHNKKFTSIFATSSIENVIKYYNLFKAKKEEWKHDLRIATIFSYWTNEESKDMDVDVLDHDINFDIDDKNIDKHTREHLDDFISDYNNNYWTKFSTKVQWGFYDYYHDIAKRVKKREIDILIVVNMFLTWFDSKSLNTLYVDKNLNNHGLIQAFSRTNRVLDKEKTIWNIVCFRNLKQKVDEAIALFSNKDAKRTIILESYETYKQTIDSNIEKLLEVVPTPEDVSNLVWEKAKMEFIKIFRTIIRNQNDLLNFSDYDKKELSIDEQTFLDYQSKYLDLKYEAESDLKKWKVSIVNDIDFETELIWKDTVNVDYIITLLQNLLNEKNNNPDFNLEKEKKKILNETNSDEKSRHLSELVEKFIDEQLLVIDDSLEVEENYTNFQEKESKEYKVNFSKEEFISLDNINKMINYYIDSKKFLGNNEISSFIENKKQFLFENWKDWKRMSFLEGEKMKTITRERIKWKIVNYYKKFN